MVIQTLNTNGSLPSVASKSGYRVDALTEAAREDVLLLADQWMESIGLDYDRDLFWMALPWEQGSYHMWGLYHGGRLVGFMDGMVVPFLVAPYRYGLVNHFYVDPSHRSWSGQLMRKGLRRAKSLGLTMVRVQTPVGGVDRWERHGFEIAEYVLERRM